MRVAILNAENLFVLLDHPPQSVKTMTEKEWQKHSNSQIENKPLKKILSLAQSIGSWNPDMLMMTEVGGAESLHHFNLYFLDNAYDEFLLEGNSDRSIDCGFLVRKNHGLNLQILSNKDEPLNFVYPYEAKRGINESHKFSRDVAELRVLSSDHLSVQAVFFLVHLKSKRDPDGIDPAGTLRRQAETQTLVRIVERRRKEFPQAKILVGGDFNGNASRINTGSEFEDLFAKTDWQDVFDLMNLDAADRVTYFANDMHGKNEGLQLDYAFVPSSQASWIKKAWVGAYDNPFGLPIRKPANPLERELIPSDHFPVLLSLDFDFPELNWPKGSGNHD